MFETGLGASCFFDAQPTSGTTPSFAASDLGSIPWFSGEKVQFLEIHFIA